MMRSILLKISENDWCRETLPSYGFVKRAVRRFMPGEELEDALIEGARMESAHGIPSLVTFLGENVADAAEAAAVADDYIQAIERIAAKGLDAEISLKPTHVGLDLGPDVVRENVLRITEAAAAHGNWVWLDMEYSRYVEPTLDLYKQVRAVQPKFGVCLQSYLHRTPADVEALIPLGAAIRLVKGAYSEPPEVALPIKRDVDEAFYDLSIRMMESDARAAGVRVGLATHDGKLINRITQWAGQNDVPDDAYEFQMLYGIGTDDQIRLAKQGKKVRILISYGTHWFPWYVRRLAERPANVGFVVKSMLPG
ncbi:MAG: proline dehydrogenase family protein [Longimicrobiales bacterium]